MIVKEGEWISVDGTTGEVFLGKVPVCGTITWKNRMTYLPCSNGQMIFVLKEGMRKAPKGSPTRGLQVWANADYPKDAQRARSYGAVGIGLCRTEHMFFEPNDCPSFNA